MNKPKTQPPSPLAEAPGSASEITATDLQYDNPDTRYEQTFDGDVEAEDDRPITDWCRANGWNSVRDCPTCGGSGQYDDSTPCPDCDDGMIDWP